MQSFISRFHKITLNSASHILLGILQSTYINTFQAAGLYKYNGMVDRLEGTHSGHQEHASPPLAISSNGLQVHNLPCTPRVPCHDSHDCGFCQGTSAAPSSMPSSMQGGHRHQRYCLEVNWYTLCSKLQVVLIFLDTYILLCIQIYNKNYILKS